jgi:hypothetical protein
VPMSFCAPPLLVGVLVGVVVEPPVAGVDAIDVGEGLAAGVFDPKYSATMPAMPPPQQRTSTTATTAMTHSEGSRFADET